MNITLDDESDTLLAQHTNQAQIVREAIKMYHGGITTDTRSGLQQSYKTLTKYMEVKFEFYDACFRRMDKLIAELESRLG